MGRWTQYDEDSYRLPEGVKRTGYDADSQTYTYSDSSGATYEGRPGQQYGVMRKVSAAPRLTSVIIRPSNPSPNPDSTSPMASSPPPPPPPYSPRRETRPSRRRTLPTRMEQPDSDRPPSPTLALRMRFGFRPEKHVVDTKTRADEDGDGRKENGAKGKRGASNATSRYKRAKEKEVYPSDQNAGDDEREEEEEGEEEEDADETRSFSDFVDPSQDSARRQRGGSVTWGLLHRAASVITNTVSPKERPEKGGTRVAALDKSGVREKEKRVERERSGRTPEREQGKRAQEGNRLRNGREWKPDRREIQTGIRRRMSVRW